MTPIFADRKNDLAARRRKSHRNRESFLTTSRAIGEPLRWRTGAFTGLQISLPAEYLGAQDRTIHPRTRSPLGIASRAEGPKFSEFLGTMQPCAQHAAV